MGEINYRNTSQDLLPVYKADTSRGKYDIYPAYDIGEGKIHASLEKLFDELPSELTILVDGYAGTFFDDIIEGLSAYYASSGRTAPEFIDIAEALKESSEIHHMVEGSMGGSDPLFGKRTGLSLIDFFDAGKLKSINDRIRGKHVLVYGIGASLVKETGFLIYLDLPKNEIQFRSRAGKTTNIGTGHVSPSHDYKRNYFIDWIVLNKHKKRILPDISIFVDAQRPEQITFTRGIHLREALNQLSTSVVRARPWFEPGPWGGTWMLDHIGGLNKEVPNYAWSFELISPENGILISSSGLLLEFSFDLLMFQEGRKVLGDAFERFGDEFPIRFDFLDTFDGGNLSIQCHPSPEYTLEEFGESFTQEETYYILDTKDNAVVYLGFQDDIEAEAFKLALNKSYTNRTPLDISNYVQEHSSSKHDLFLIPYGTIHGSGRNNLVLEISSTPYIFTFKMYDWLRKDLNGQLRTINIDRGMLNLQFHRKGKLVQKELISKPVVIDEGEDWVLEHLPTHRTQLYDVHRYSFKQRIRIETKGKCHVLSLVEGSSILVETESGQSTSFSYAETFIIPAASGSYTIKNESGREAKLVKAFVK
jgi:mannose-6-phosphate isomerase class I